MKQESDWIKPGVIAMHKHDDDAHSLGEVFICDKPRLIKGNMRVIVMPEDKSRWLVGEDELEFIGYVSPII